MKIRIIFIAFLIFTSLGAAPVLGVDEYVYIKKGDLAEKEGNFSYALEQYNKALEIDPEKEWIYLRVGKIYRENIGDPEAAIESYKVGLKYLSQNFEINRALMYTYFEAGLIRQGMEAYEKLSEINIDNKKFSFTREAVDKLKKKMDEPDLFELSKKYISLNPRDIILREFMADYLYGEKRYPEAMEHYRLLLNYTSSKGPVYFALAMCQYNLQKFDKALISFKKADEYGEDVPRQYYDILKDRLDQK